MKTSKEEQQLHDAIIDVAMVEFNQSRKRRLDEMGYDPDKHILQIECFYEREKITILPRGNYPSKEFYLPTFKDA